MSDNRLKTLADRIDRLEDEKKGISGDIKDVYTEVKSAGYNTKALRKVLADRRKKTDAELEADMELYRAELAKPGATYRSVAEKTGVPKSTLQRRVPRDRNGTTEPVAKPEDGDDGITEITPEQGRPEQQSPSGQAAPTLSDEAPATPSADAVGPSSGRVAPPTDAEAEAAMDEAFERLKASRDRRLLRHGAGA